MPWINFGNLPGGDQPASLFDTQFANVAGWATVACSASGTNAITLTPLLSGFVPQPYADHMAFAFRAAADSTGAVTLGVGSQPQKPVFGADGVSQLGAGAVLAERVYVAVYNSALNSGAGGWHLSAAGVASGVVPVSLGGTGQTTAQAARSASGLNIDQVTAQTFNADFAIAATARTVVSTSAAMTAARTATLPAANAVNAGQALDVIDLSGVTGVYALTIQRTGSDTVNGGASVALQEAFAGWRFKSDGTSKWTASYLPPAKPTSGSGGGGGLVAVEFRTSSATITIPSGATRLKVTLVGGGGGSGGNNTTSEIYGAPGGGGATLVKYLTGLTPGNTLALTVGAGGSAGGTGSSGGAGGNTVLSSGSQSITTLTAGGGAGGQSSTTPPISAGGTATNGDINIPGERSVNRANKGGSCLFGFGGVTNADGTPAAGTGYGGGASSRSDSSSGSGAAGAPGIAIFEWYA